MRRADLVPPALGLALAVLVGNVLILAVGGSPLRVWSILLAGTWGNSYGVGQVLFKATPLALAGLSVAVAYRAGLFNVGAEGQLSFGALTTTLAGLALPAGTPWLVALPICVLAGMAGGGIVGAVPGLLKARFGTNEVIGTIMLNFIVLGTIQWLLSPDRLAEPETTSTAAVIGGARIPRLATWLPALRGSAASFAILAALLAAAGVHALFTRTRLGFELRAQGASPPAAEAGGVAPARSVVVAMTLSGAIAGLVGLNNVLGYKGYYEAGFSAGIGFMGLAVAMLGRSHPAGVLLAALLFGTLSQGALAIHAVVPKELVDVLQAVVILSVVATSGDALRRGAR
jgi:simple sugar transport system permease protein